MVETESNNLEKQTPNEIIIPNDQINLGSTNNTLDENSISNDNRDNIETYKDQELEIIEESDLLKESKTQSNGRSRLNYFGYDIFKKRPSLFQASSVGAVDPDYIIGPGDEIIVMM